MSEERGAATHRLARVIVQGASGSGKTTLAVAIATGLGVAHLELDGLYPQYGFAEHKGYATQRHIEALTAHGPCAAHRRGFWRVRDAVQLLPGLS